MQLSPPLTFSSPLLLTPTSRGLSTKSKETYERLARMVSEDDVAVVTAASQLLILRRSAVGFLHYFEEAEGTVNYNPKK